MSDKRSTASNSIAAITNPSFPHPQAQCKRKRDPLLPLDPIDNNINKSSKRPRTAACTKTQTLRGSIRRRASDIIRAAWKCPDLSLLHPAAHVRDNQVIIPSVSATVFKCAQARISSSAAASKRIRLEHSRSKTSVANSKLLITMPTRIHEIMKAFASEIKSQMFTPDPHTGRAFIPGSWERSRVFETGSPSLELQYGDKTLVRQPDASLAFQPDNPFLVVEVAVTQDAEAAKRKAKEYIIGSRGKIAVVLVIVVRRLNRRAIKERTDEGRELSRAGKPSPDQQGQQHMGNQVGGVSTPSTISTLTDPPSDLSQWDVFPNQPSGALVDQASINKTTSDSSLSLPPFLYKALDTEEILNAGDTIHTSVFKAVTIPSQTSPELSTRTIHSVVEEVEVYPHTTSASFTIDWLDISKTAPRDAGPSLHVDLGPLSDLARALEAHGSGEVHDDGFRPLTDESVEYVPSSSTWGDVDWERSGGTIPSDVEKLRDPSFSP